MFPKAVLENKGQRIKPMKKIAFE